MTYQALDQENFLFEYYARIVTEYCQSLTKSLANLMLSTD